ncbi:MAG: S16 family serine protease [Pyrinomonadaceae bacterium]
MEILRLSGYTEQEKLEIAKQHLVPKQAEANGIKIDQLDFTTEAIKEVIRSYTREAGVRNLEREIGSCCRKLARKVVAEQKSEDFKEVVTAERVRQMLGPIKFRQHSTAAQSEVGLATGLAWTELGGEVLANRSDAHTRARRSDSHRQAWRSDAGIGTGRADMH